MDHKTDHACIFSLFLYRGYSAFAGRKAVDVIRIYEIYIRSGCLVCVCYCFVLYNILVCVEVQCS